MNKLSKREVTLLIIFIKLIGYYILFHFKIKFIKNIESYKKTIGITDFYSVNKNGTTKSKIIMNIYTINKDKKDDELIIK